MPATTMKAAVITGHGGLEVVTTAHDLPVPTPGRGEVRLKMKAAALNRLDLWVRAGWKGLELHMPHVIAADGAGVVDAVGDGVAYVQPGDRVSINPTLIDLDQLLLTGDESLILNAPILGEHAPGVAAEYVVLPARNLLKLPDQVTFEQAAAAGLVYVTAWSSLITRGGLQAGESVLIVGAGGGVNSASIQIAKLAGCTVYVVGSSAEKCAQAEALGADVTINRADDPAWSKALYKLTDKRGVDVVVDNVGQATLPDSLRAAKRGGRILIVGNTTGYNAQIDTRFLFGKHLSLIGSSMGSSEDYRRVMALVFEGKLKPVIGAVLPLEAARKGQEMLEAGAVFGKVVLVLNG
ncbi:MAG: zinc-binding dehydrogenase [bacterium]|nr:zinc-binding dehydrogenase [bacterium]